MLPYKHHLNLVFLPASTACNTQPVDKGVVRSIKTFYPGMTVRRCVDVAENGKPPPNIIILDAMTILVGAWNRGNNLKLLKKKLVLAVKHGKVPYMTIHSGC